MSKHRNISPPRWPFRLLHYFLRPEYAEEIGGDLEERFQDDMERYYPAKARRLLIWEIIKLIRPALIRKVSGPARLNHFGMFKNDFKTIFRIIRKEKLYTGINVVGLTAGLSVALLILAYVHFEFSYETHNSNAKRVARITIDYLDGQTLIDQDCESYHLLGPIMKEEFPEVADYARTYRMWESVIKIDEKRFRASKVYAVDPSFLKIFDYPLINGDESTALSGPLEAVLTESTALRFFGTLDVIGQTMWDSAIRNTLKVVGVIHDSPANTHFKFDMLTSYATMEPTVKKRESQWDSNDTFTYVLLNNGSQYEQFESSLERLTQKLTKEEKIKNERIIGQRIEDIHLYSHKSYEAEANGNATVVLFLFYVALLVIIIAIVNYINLATAKSLDRAKEVGIRKVVGSSKVQLKVRFFIESFFVNLVSGLLCVVLIYVLLNDFRQIAGLPADFTVFDNPLFWMVWGALILFSTLFAGSFPAFILSSFKPVAVLKGKFTHSSGGIMLRKSLVVFQFAIAIFLLIQTLTSTEQLQFMQEKDLGLDAERMIVVPAPVTAEEMKNFKPFTDQLLNTSAFSSVSLSTCIPGLPTSTMGSTTGINLIGATEEHNFNFFIYHIDHQFIPGMKIELAAGENYQETVHEDRVIVNEEAIRLWGIRDAKDALNKKIHLWGKERSITGVVKNFHQTGVKSGHIAMILMQSSGFGDYVSIRTAPGNIKEQLSEVRELYKANFHSPFDYFFLDQKFDSHFRSDQQFQTVFSVLSLFALLITCLGLFGLASFTVAKRRKEIGIRKVLGASVAQMIALLSRDFLRLISIAALVALPVTYLIVNNWLNTYAYRINITFWLFAGPAALVLIVAFITIFSRTLRASEMNPVSSLRDE